MDHSNDMLSPADKNTESLPASENPVLEQQEPSSVPPAAPTRQSDSAPVGKKGKKKKKKWPLFLIIPAVLLIAGAGIFLFRFFNAKEGPAKANEASALFYEGLLPAAVYPRSNSPLWLWGYLDTDGKWAIEPQFRAAGNFSKNGLAPVQEESNGKYGFIDKSGTYIIPPHYDTALEFDVKGFACVQLNKKWGYIDKNGNQQIKFLFDTAEPFTESGLALVSVNGKYGYIDTEGAYVIDPKFEMAFDFLAVSAFVYLYGGWGKINKKGEWIINPQFDLALPCSDGQSIFVMQDGRFGLCDNDGNYLVEPTYEKMLISGEYGYLPYCKNGLWGYMDRNGEVVISPKFKEAYPFTDAGLALVRDIKSNNYGYIDQYGEWVMNPKYKEASSFSNGVAKIYLNDLGHYDYINKDGKILLALDKTRKAESLYSQDGYVIVSKTVANDRTLYAIINSEGDILCDNLAAVGDTQSLSLLPLEDIISFLLELIQEQNQQP